jgi:hypothetical protein
LTGALVGGEWHPFCINAWALSQAFDYSLDFKSIDFRQRPELYRIGRGEQGVLLVEPYKSELLPHWRFKTVAEAEKSSAKIRQCFARI